MPSPLPHRLRSSRPRGWGAGTGATTSGKGAARVSGNMTPEKQQLGGTQGVKRSPLRSPQAEEGLLETTCGDVVEMTPTDQEDLLLSGPADMRITMGTTDGQHIRARPVMIGHPRHGPGRGARSLGQLASPSSSRRT